MFLYMFVYMCKYMFHIYICLKTFGYLRANSKGEESSHLKLQFKDELDYSLYNYI